jgi:hypothetical protein
MTARRKKVEALTYRCEGCGSDAAPYKCGTSRQSRLVVPDGIARWCYSCSRQFLSKAKRAAVGQRRDPE